MKPTQSMRTPAVERARHCAWHPPSCRSRAAASKGAKGVTALWAALFILTTATLAQTSDNIAEREVQRRQAAIPEGEAALARGKSALKARNYTVAYQEFKTAIGYLPDAVVSGKAHDEAADGV